MRLLRVPLPVVDLDRLDALRPRLPAVTRRTSLAAALVRVGLSVVERDPSALFRAVLADPVEPVELPQLSPRNPA